MTSAYTVFPNQGVRMKPFEVLKVLDREGNLLEDDRAEPVDVVRADTAYVMTSLMRGVIQRGTAAAAGSIDWPLAGKTGTVDDNTDAWFVGFDPDLTVGVWVGYDEKKSLGSLEQGSYAALPIWMDVMKGYIDSRPDKDTPPTVRRARQHRLSDRRQAHGHGHAARHAGDHHRGVHLRHAAGHDVHPPAGLSERLPITKTRRSRRSRET